MKKAVAEKIVKLYNELYANTTEDTHTRAELQEPYLKFHKATSWEVEIVPTASNDGEAFYASHECVDICRAFKVSFIVSLDGRKLIGRFF